MMGVTLTRWTMLYFATALLALIGGELLMVFGFGFPAAELQAPQTLFLVHTIAIGWLSFLICGALFQFVPVLIAHPLHSDSVPLAAYVFLVAGLAGLLAGFLQLAGILKFTPSLLPWGASALGIGFLFVLYNLAVTMWEARPIPLQAQFVVVALVSLVAVAAFGITFSFGLSGSTQSALVMEITALGLPLHIIAALGGWLTFTAMGVSYRLLAMFMLAPELHGKRPHASFWLGTAALAIAVLGGLALLLSDMPLTAALLVAAALAVASVGLYGADTVYLYKKRKRPKIELNSRMAGYALASLAATGVLLVALLAIGRFTDEIGAFIFLAAFGWLGGLGLAMLYKITAFLSWLECYGPLLGKMPTPRVQDLAIEPRAYRWFYLYFGAVWAGTLLLLADQALLFRVAAAAMVVATVAITIELVRIRKLVNIPENKRLAEKVATPHLLMCVETTRPA